MANKTHSQPKSPIGRYAHERRSLYSQMLAFLESMLIRNYSPKTTEKWQEMLRAFLVWCEERGLSYPNEISLSTLESYQRYLFHYRKTDGKPLSARTQRSYLVPIKAWFKWLTKSHIILSNPASELALPKKEYRLPKAILTEHEVDVVMNTPDITDMFGLRDRAILEVLYSTGIRRSELINLNKYSIDGERGTITIRQGKGHKDRIIPIGERAIYWVEQYQNKTRPLLESYSRTEEESDALFLTKAGEMFSPNRLSHLVRTLIDKANLGKSGSCHLLRHTMATLMLENGADLRWIQAMLGHASPETTQIYTQVSIRALKDIHSATHPAASLERNNRNKADNKVAKERERRAKGRRTKATQLLDS